MDEDSKAKLRRYNRNIEISGMAMIFYAYWSVVKFFAPIVIGGTNAAEYIGIDMNDYLANKALAWIAVVLTLGILFSVYYFLGKSAVKYARGKKRRKGFIVYAAIVFLVTAIGMIDYPEELLKIRHISDADSVVASFVVDLTLLFMLFDMMYSTIRGSKFRKMEEQMT